MRGREETHNPNQDATTSSSVFRLKFFILRGTMNLRNMEGVCDRLGKRSVRCRGLIDEVRTVKIKFERVQSHATDL
jgi:hypothetical protein